MASLRPAGMFERALTAAAVLLVLVVVYACSVPLPLLRLRVPAQAHRLMLNTELLPSFISLPCFPFRRLDPPVVPIIQHR